MSSHSVKLAKALRHLQWVKDIQGSKGNWDYDPYMHGMYNGIELAMAIMQDREPVYKDAPDVWRKDLSLPRFPAIATNAGEDNNEAIL